VDAEQARDVDVAAAWIRDGRQVTLFPVRARLSRAGNVLAILSVPWLLFVILGVVALYSAMGYQSSRIPPDVRALSVIVGFAPLALGGLVGVLSGYGLGPMLGLGWAFDKRTLVIDAASLRLVDGASERWAIDWTSVVSIEPIDQGIGQASGLALIGDRDTGTRVIPSPLLSGRVAGTGLMIDVVGLVAAMHAPP
jgi:hypothetical protein